MQHWGHSVLVVSPRAAAAASLNLAFLKSVRAI